nr:MAG TPA: hypothetical protein [Caudoviricetes sp.]
MLVLLMFNIVKHSYRPGYLTQSSNMVVFSNIYY